MQAHVKPLLAPHLLNYIDLKQVTGSSPKSAGPGERHTPQRERGGEAGDCLPNDTPVSHDYHPEKAELCPLKFHMLKPGPPKPQNATAFGNRALQKVITLK